MEKLPKYIFGAVILFLMVSCRSQKQAVDSSRREFMINKHSAAEAVFSTRRTFRTFKVKKMSIEIKINGLSDHLRGNIAVSRDSMIAISVMPIVGYEALRIMFTKDSLILINRTDKTYQASSLDYYLARYNIPVSFDDLQALLVNEAFFYMKGYKDREYKEEIKRENGQIILHIESIKGNQKITNQKITADNSCCQIENIFVADYQRNVQVEIKYNDFDDSKVWPFPNRVSVDIWDGINTISMNIRYHQIIFDDQINVRFEIPLNYSRAHM